MAKKGSKKKRKRRQKVYLARFIFALFLITVLGLLGFLGYKLVGKIAEKSGPKEVLVTTLTVNKNGSIDEVLVEDFDESLYDENQLLSMINEELSRYGNAVKFEGLEVESGKARLTISYEDDKAYSGFNGTVFYADTIDNVKSLGVQLPGEALLAGGDHVVVMSESMDINVPKKIKYSSPGITVSDRQKSASVTVADGANAVIVY